MEARKMAVFDYIYPSNDPLIGEKKKIVRCVGEFQAWGVNFEQFEEGIGNYSTAIVLLDDGSLLNHPVEMVQFVGFAENTAEAR